MTTSGISFRTAQPEDAAGIAELGTRTFLPAFGDENKPKEIEACVGESFSCETVERQIMDPHSAFLLVVRDNTNIGYGKLRRGKVPACVNGQNPIELERIYVDASHQGGGVGATLIQAAIDHAGNEGYGTVWLGTWKSNAGARKFYERQVFFCNGNSTTEILP